MKEKLTKRYAPFTAVGTFVCSHCVIESAKNIISSEYPEILQIETHKKDDPDDSLNMLALKCILNIITKKNLKSSLTAMNSEVFMTCNFPGTLFVGSTIENIKDDETKIDFAERIKNEIISLELMKTKVDEDMTEDDQLHYNELFEVKYLSDIVVIFTEKEDENDLDDLDIGYEKGVNDGIEENYHVVQVALYKMAKKKKIKNLDFLLDEIHNTINGMDEKEFKGWSNNFTKYMKKKNEKEKNIEGDN